MASLQSAAGDELRQLSMHRPGLIPERIWNKLCAIIGSLRLRPGIGYRIRGLGFTGFTLEIDIPKPPPFVQAWPFKVYNTTAGPIGQVQINGNDGFVASLNGFIFNVNGSPNNVKSGTPAVYPQLSVTGNGVIYAYAIPTTPGTAIPLSSGDIYYAGTIPASDPSNPQTYFPFLLATISNYAVDGSGNVSFTVSNAFNYGPSQLIYCGGQIQVY